MNAESVSVSSSTDESCLSGLWLHAGKQSVWRAKEAESIDGNTEPIGYCLTMI